MEIIEDRSFTLIMSDVELTALYQSVSLMEIDLKGKISQSSSPLHSWQRDLDIVQDMLCKIQDVR
jgi:hypothetical protein